MTNLNKEIENLSFRWEETEYGCFLNLSLYNVYVTRQSNGKHKIEIGNYVHQERPRNINKAKLKALEIIQQFNNLVELKLLSSPQNEDEVEVWKVTLFGR